ncbi:Mg/Co/Ni transporter MgtE [Candidatus Scalindua japonica]|uniref:Magnesium transporter MgtE n=1 Tax=Candidatus Scalindua japonica TaxID=1284222 RepID=A0A286U3A6_9BACT|nr:magnesium transporter [Candidatus Scalindua japonica]GAX62620.1 Mg/Co/Ni transporter MgtE [Candidatus Scalindua japonica]
MSDQELLLSIVRKLVEDDCEKLAWIMEGMDEAEVLNVMKILPHALSAKVVSVLPQNLVATLLIQLPSEFLEKIVGDLDPEKISDIILSLPEELRYDLLEKTPQRKKKLIREMLTFPEDSVGRIMSRDYLAFHVDLKVKDATNKIKAMARRKASFSYAYVVDSGNRLVGVLRMFDLIAAPRDVTLRSIMKEEVYTIDSFSDREDIANDLKIQKYSTAPVVDAQNHLIGIVRAEKLIMEAQEDVAQDIQMMVGVAPEERTFSSIWFSLRRRLPWLHINLVTAFAAAGVVAIFEDLIHQITALAIFLPVVAGQGGNAGAQTLAVVMRGLVMREIPKGRFKGLLMKEAGLGALNGVIIGMVTAVIAWLWKANPFLGIVIGLGMIVNLIAAGLAGATIPIIMKKLGADPAQSSSIILTTITDVVGFFAFLSFAVMFQQFLI